MDHFETFVAFLKRLCAAGAEAIERYAQASRIDPASGHMPESFLESIVLNRLGLKADRSGVKLRLGATLASLGAEHIRNERPDKAVFHPGDASLRLGLVEFKVHASKLDLARERLLRISVYSVRRHSERCAPCTAAIRNPSTL